MGSSPLKVIFPRLYRIAANNLASIGSMGYWDGFHWQWSFEWTRELRPQDKVEEEKLQQLLNGVCPALESSDELN